MHCYRARAQKCVLVDFANGFLDHIFRVRCCAPFFQPTFDSCKASREVNFTLTPIINKTCSGVPGVCGTLQMTQALGFKKKRMQVRGNFNAMTVPRSRYRLRMHKYRSLETWVSEQRSLQRNQRSPYLTSIRQDTKWIPTTLKGYYS